MADKPIQVLIVDDEPVCLEQSRQKIALYVGEEHILSLIHISEPTRQ